MLAELVTEPQIDYKVLFYSQIEDQTWRDNLELMNNKIIKERGLVPSGSPTQIEKDLCIGINQRVLNDSEHYIKEGQQSEHFLQITKTRLHLIKALKIHPDAANIVYDNYFTTFSSWRADSLQTKDGVKRFFEETQKVGFPKQEVEERVLIHIGKGIVASKETRNDILDKRQLKDEQDEKSRLPSHVLTGEIAQAMSITEGELNEKIFNLIADACNPNIKVSKSMELSTKLGIQNSLYIKSDDIDTVVRAGVKLGVPEQTVLNKMKEVWPTPTLSNY